jgi:hypothetical protein
MFVKKRFRDSGGAGQVFGGGLGVTLPGKKRQRGLNDGRFSLLRGKSCFLQEGHKLVDANLMSSEDREKRERKYGISENKPT